MQTHTLVVPLKQCKQNQSQTPAVIYMRYAGCTCCTPQTIHIYPHHQYIYPHDLDARLPDFITLIKPIISDNYIVSSRNEWVRNISWGNATMIVNMRAPGIIKLFSRTDVFIRLSCNQYLYILCSRFKCTGVFFYCADWLKRSKFMISETYSLNVLC